MSDARMALLELIEKGADADLVRELLAYAEAGAWPRGGGWVTGCRRLARPSAASRFARPATCSTLTGARAPRATSPERPGRKGQRMSIIGWIVLGLIAGFIASKIVNSEGQGLLLDIVLGIVGAVVGGFLFNQLSGRPA